MKTALIQLTDDFVSAIAFVVLFAWTGNLIAASVTAILVAIGQALYGIACKKPWTPMRWMALALALFLGGLTLLTRDSRFIQLKPSLAHFAIGAVMLKSGWQLPYLPEIVRTVVPQRRLLGWGDAWAALMFVMGVVNLVAAYTLGVGAWSVVVTLLLFGKIAFFVLQYAVLRITVRRLRYAC